MRVQLLMAYVLHAITIDPSWLSGHTVMVLNKTLSQRLSSGWQITRSGKAVVLISTASLCHSDIIYLVFSFYGPHTQRLGWGMRCSGYPSVPQTTNQGSPCKCPNIVGSTPSLLGILPGPSPCFVRVPWAITAWRVWKVHFSWNSTWAFSSLVTGSNLSAKGKACSSPNRQILIIQN